MWLHLLICLAFSYPACCTVYEGLFLLVGGASFPSYLQCSRSFAPHRKIHLQLLYPASTVHNKDILHVGTTDTFRLLPDDHDHCSRWEERAVR